MLRAMDRPCMISRTTEIGLRVLGIWPGMSYQNLSRFLWMTSLILFQMFQYHYFVAYYNTESISHLVDNLSTALPFSNMCFKFTSFWFNEGVLRDILTTMSRGCQIRANTATNNLISKSANLCHRLVTAQIFAYLLAAIVYAMGFVLFEAQFGGQDGQPRKLLFLMKLPFDTNKLRVYNTVLVIQFVHQIACVTSIGLIGGLLLTVILHVGCQVEILCQRLTTIRCNNTKQLGYLIGMHQDIISLIENTEKLFTYTALLLLISSSLTICCVGFLIAVSIGTEHAFDTLFKCALFYVSVAMELFLYCFAGEYLSTKSKMIGDAAYESIWYDLRPNECRVLLFMILRAQKNLTLTMGKISSLSLNSFATVLKASASYTSVLLAMN